MFPDMGPMCHAGPLKLSPILQFPAGGMSFSFWPPLLFAEEGSWNGTGRG